MPGSRGKRGEALALVSCGAGVQEDAALLLAAYCAVQSLAERKRGLAELRAWYLWPMGVAVLWFRHLAAKIITPALELGKRG